MYRFRLFSLAAIIERKLFLAGEAINGVRSFSGWDNFGGNYQSTKNTRDDEAPFISKTKFSFNLRLCTRGLKTLIPAIPPRHTYIKFFHLLLGSSHAKPEEYSTAFLFSIREINEKLLS